MIYTPSEDSYLLAKEVAKYAKRKKVLDIGSGSGILAEAARKAGALSVLAVDINPLSISAIKKKNISVIHSNIFSSIKKNKKFDLIICNPPYLPLDRREGRESAQNTTGGKKGDEFILRFLKQSPYFLDKNGIILLLLSSLTPQKRILALLKKLHCKHEIISSQKLFFEELSVWKITQHRQPAMLRL